jgi:hypothetical protein
MGSSRVLLTAGDAAADEDSARSVLFSSNVDRTYHHESQIQIPPHSHLPLHRRLILPHLPIESLFCQLSSLISRVDVP